MDSKKDDLNTLKEIRDIKKVIKNIAFKNKKSLERITSIAEEQAQKLRVVESVLESLVRIQGMYLIAKPKEEIFEELLAILLKESKSEYGFIGEVLYDSENQPYLKTFALTNISWDASTRKFYEDNAPDGLEFKNLETLFGETLKTGKMIIANDPKNHPNSGGLPKGHPPLNAYLGIPLYVNKKMVGMFGIANREGEYSEKLVELLQPVINSVAQLVFAQRKDCFGCANKK